MKDSLGFTLVEQEFISESQLTQALARQSNTGDPLGDCVRALGFCREDELQQAIQLQRQRHLDTQKQTLSLSPVAQLRPYLRAQKGHWWVIFLLSAFAGAMSSTILMPFLVGNFIEVIIPSHDNNAAWEYFTLGMGAMFIGVFSNGLTCYYINIVVARIGTDLQSEVTQRVYDFSVAMREQFSDGDLLSRMVQDVENVLNNVRVILLIVFQHSFQLVFGMAVMLYLNTYLALACLPLLYIFAVVPSKIGKKANPYVAKQPAQLGEINQRLKDWWGLKEFLQAHPHSNRISDHVLASMQAYYKTNFSQWAFWNISHNAKTSLHLLISALVLWGGSVFVVHGHMSVGELVIFYLMVEKMIGKMGFVTGLYITYQSLRQNQRRLNEILLRPDHAKEVDASGSLQDIAFHNVHFRYSHTQPDILSNVSFSLQPGMRYGLVGASGSGKSTVLDLLCGLRTPTQGRISVNQHLPFSLDGWRHNLAVMQQDIFLLEGHSVRDNLAMGCYPAPSDTEIHRALSLAQAETVITRLPDGLDTIIESNLPFSAGEQQRLSMARIFLRQAALNIFDEPTAALDPEVAGKAILALLNQSHQPIIVCATHDVAHLVHFDVLLEVKEGGVLLHQNTEQARRDIVDRYGEEYRSATEEGA